MEKSNRSVYFSLIFFFTAPQTEKIRIFILLVIDCISDCSGGHQFKEYCFITVILYALYLMIEIID